MSDVNSKVKFYSFGSKKIDFSKLENMLDLDATKPVVVSKGFNKALKSVIEKDIDFIARKIKQIVKEIKKILVVNDIVVEQLDDNIDNIDVLVSKIDSVISNIIINKENLKVGIFSTNKKEKKKKANSLDECSNLLTKYQTEIIAIKNEYNKLKERKSVLYDVEPEEKEETDELDPLERTINFYLSKQKNS